MYLNFVGADNCEQDCVGNRISAMYLVTCLQYLQQCTVEHVHHMNKSFLFYKFNAYIQFYKQNFSRASLINSNVHLWGMSYGQTKHTPCFLQM